MQPRNMKQVRAELTIWGQFWYGHEQLQGYSRRSACDKLNKVRTDFNSYLLENEINSPPLVRQYDLLIDCMLPECKRALRACYVCSKEISKIENNSNKNVIRKSWVLVGFKSEKEYFSWLKIAEIQLL